jgi:hypothetical protein
MRKATTAAAPSAVRTMCSFSHLTIRARALMVGLGRIGGHQPIVGGHDRDERIRPVGEDQQGADEKGKDPGLPPGDAPEDKAEHGQRPLHGETALVGRLPLGQECAVVQSEAGRLLGGIDIERSTGKNGSNQRARSPISMARSEFEFPRRLSITFPSKLK